MFPWLIFMVLSICFRSPILYTLLPLLSSPTLSSGRPMDTSELSACYVQLWETWIVSNVHLNKPAFYQTYGWKWFWINVWLLLKLCTLPSASSKKISTSTDLLSFLHFSLGVPTSPSSLNSTPPGLACSGKPRGLCPTAALISLSCSLSNSELHFHHVAVSSLTSYSWHIVAESSTDWKIPTSIPPCSVPTKALLAFKIVL